MNERLEYASQWIEEVRKGEYWSAYWNLFLAFDARTASNDRNSGAIMTNICKIGVLQGNPRAQYLAFQLKLAIETLRLEMEIYRPRLIVFVTGDYAEDVVMQVRGNEQGTAWQKRDDDRMWWREGSQAAPAMLWTYHPQGKSRSMIDAWLQKGSELLSM